MPASDVVLPYGALRGYIDGKNTILLYHEARDAHVIPKRAFSSDQLGRIRGWLAARASVRRHWFSRPEVVIPALAISFLAGIMVSLIR
jgi:hypothetical protein